MDWHFQKHDGYSDIDQSSSADAFSGHSVRDLATALIREGIQNSIDARSSDDPNAEPVRVRHTLGTSEGKPEDINQRWFSKLLPDLHEEDVGAPRPTLSENYTT